MSVLQATTAPPAAAGAEHHAAATCASFGTPAEHAQTGALNLTLPIPYGRHATTERRFSPTRFIRRHAAVVPALGLASAADKRYSLGLAPMLRRTLLSLSLLPLSARPAIAQSAQDPFRPSEYAAILPEHGLETDFSSLTEGSQIYVPPMFRYRLTLQTAGVIQPVAEPRRQALDRWAGTFRGQDFIQRFTHEVQVKAGDQGFWLPWQQALIKPFHEEMRGGGTMSVKVLFAGAIKGQLLLLAIGYQQL